MGWSSFPYSIPGEEDKIIWMNEEGTYGTEDVEQESREWNNLNSVTKQPFENNKVTGVEGRQGERCARFYHMRAKAY